KISFLKVIIISTRILPVKSAGALLLLLSLAGACADPSEIGLVLDPSSNQIGVFYEEIPLSASMVLLDSFNTTGQGVLLVGGDQSEFFGTTTSIGYSRLSFNPFGELPTEEALFDSAIFTLNVVESVGEDFDEPKSFKVHQLTEPILDTTYYNFNALPFAEESLAEGSFIIRPDTLNSLRMNLEEELTSDLFQRMTSNDPVFTNVFTFRDYFPGIAILGGPDDNATSTLGIGGGTGIIIYYHYEGDTVSTSYPINTIQSRHFNHITNDRQGTPTDVITERGEVYQVPGEKVGIKGNLGMVIKLDMEPAHAFLDTLENITFNQITLEVGPVDEHPEFKGPFNNLLMYFCTDEGEFYNRFDGARVAVQQNGQSQTGLGPDGSVVPTNSNQNSLIYVPDSLLYQNEVTSYVNALYRSGLVKTDLFLYPNRPSSSNNPVSSDLFKRSTREFISGKDQFKLKVYYTRVR
ncbi:MAG: hypothetical protein WD398_10870, partial [Cyclobacteriaceae bacterium]